MLRRFVLSSPCFSLISVVKFTYFDQRRWCSATSLSSTSKNHQNNNNNSPELRFLDLCDECSRKSSALMKSNSELRGNLIESFEVIHQMHQPNATSPTSASSFFASLDILCSLLFKFPLLKKDFDEKFRGTYFSSPEFVKYFIQEQEMSQDNNEGFLKENFSSETLVILSEGLEKFLSSGNILNNRFRGSAASERKQSVNVVLTKMLSIVTKREASLGNFQQQGDETISSMTRKMNLLIRTAFCATRLLSMSSSSTSEQNMEIVKSCVHEIELSLQRTILATEKKSNPHELAQQHHQSEVGDAHEQGNKKMMNSSTRYKLPHRSALQLLVILYRAKIKKHPDLTKRMSALAAVAVATENNLPLLIDALKGTVSAWNFHPTFFPALIRRLAELAPRFGSKQVYETSLCLKLMSRRNPETGHFAELKKHGPELRKFVVALEQRSQEVSLTPRQAKTVVIALSKGGAKCTRNVLEATVVVS